MLKSLWNFRENEVHVIGKFISSIFIALIIVLNISQNVVRWPSVVEAKVSGPENLTAFLSNKVARDSLIVRIRHDPRGYNLNHDYFMKSEDPFVKELVWLVEIGHVNRVTPRLKTAALAPEDRKMGYYRHNLQDLEYTLERIVNHPRALLLLEAVAILAKRPYLPEVYYRRALKMYPNRALTQAQFGKFLIDHSQIEEGVKRLELAVQLAPKLGVAHAWLSLAYQKQGKKDLALQFSQKAKDLGYKDKLPAEIREIEK